MPTIDGLIIEIEANSGVAEKGLERLADALDRVRAASSNLRGFNAAAKGLKNLATEAGSLNFSGVQAIDELGSALSKLSALNGVKISSSFARQIRAISESANLLNTTNMSGIQSLAATLSPLYELEKATNLNSTVRALKKIPDAIDGVTKIDASKVKEFAEKMNDLRDAVHPLADEMRAVSAGFSSLPGNIQKAINANQRFSESTARTRRGLSDMLRQLLTFGTAYYAVKNVFERVMGAFDRSNAYIETMNLVNITLGEGAQAAKEYAAQVERLAGIDSVEWLRNVGTLGQMFRGFGTASQEAARMSENLTKVAYDIQSAYDVADLGEVMRRIQSGITGEVEGMRRYGVDLTNASMQEYLHARGLNVKVSALSQAQKATVRYNMIMEKTRSIQGNLAREIATPANALRILSNQIAVAARHFGNLVSVIATAVIPIMSAVVKAISFAAQALAALFGFKLPSSGGGVSDGLDKVSDSLDSVGGAAGGAKDELKGLLASFDELNIIQQDVSAGGGGGGGGAGIDIEDLMGDYDYDFLAGLKEDENGFYAQMVKAIEERNWTGLGSLLGDKLNEIVRNADFAGFGEKLGKGFDGALSFLYTAIRTFDFWGLGTKIAQFVNNAIRNVTFENVGGILASKLTTMWDLALSFVTELEWDTVARAISDTIVGAVKEITQWVESIKWDDVGKKLYENINDLFSEVMFDSNIDKSALGEIATSLSNLFGEAVSSAIELFGGTVGSLWDDLASYFKPYIDDAGGNIALGIFKGLEEFDMFGRVTSWVLDNIVTPIDNKIEEHFGVRPIQTFLNTVAFTIKPILTSIADWIEEHVINYIADKCRQMGIDMEVFLSDPWNSLKSLILGSGGTSGILSDILAGMSSWAGSIWETIRPAIIEAGKSIGKGLGDALVEAFKTSTVGKLVANVSVVVPGSAKNKEFAMNTAIAADNAIKSTGNVVSNAISSVTSGIKKLFGFAGGGYPQTGQLFLAREAGPELVGSMGGRTAVANNDQIVDGIASGVSDANARIERQNEEIIRLLRVIGAKETSVQAAPSAAWGRMMRESERLYAKSAGLT